MAENSPQATIAVAATKACGDSDFVLVGSTECSVSGETMSFVANLSDGIFTIQGSEWYNESDPSEFEDYDTFEEYCEDYDDVGSEADFEKLKNNKTFFVDDKYVLEIPFCDPYRLEY